MIRTRFAPSPTGFLHIGGLRSAVYPYALAKHNGGKFILRIEDTDQKREVAGAKAKVFAMLKTFGLKWDEEYIQSERVKTGIYKEAAEKLIAAGNAYEDVGAVRIKIPKGEEISYHDFALNKDISWQTDVLEDMVLLKSDGFPTYHLAVVVDDHDMGITHVLRGHDWLPSTPIHLLLYKFFGWEKPEIGHLTDILDPDEGGKLSKRKGSASVEQLLQEGYLQEAILNFVILLGWAPKDNRELFTLEEFVKEFDAKGFQKSNPVMNLKKLDWFNGHYIRQKSDKELIQLIKPFSKYAGSEHFPKLITMVKDRLVKLSDFDDLVRFIFEDVHPEKALFPADAQDHLEFAKQIFDIKDIIPEIKARGWKIGDFFMSLRVAVCGSKFTPPINDVMQVLGKTDTLKRIDYALRLLTTPGQT